MRYELCFGHKGLLREIPHRAGGVDGARDQACRVESVPVERGHRRELVEVLRLGVREGSLFHQLGAAEGSAGAPVRTCAADVACVARGVVVWLDDLVDAQALRRGGKSVHVGAEQAHGGVPLQPGDGVLDAVVVAPGERPRVGCRSAGGTGRVVHVDLLRLAVHNLKPVGGVFSVRAEGDLGNRFVSRYGPVQPAEREMRRVGGRVDGGVLRQHVCVAAENTCRVVGQRGRRRRVVHKACSGSVGCRHGRGGRALAGAVAPVTGRGAVAPRPVAAAAAVAGRVQPNVVRRECVPV